MKKISSLICLLLIITAVSCKKKATLDGKEVLTVCGTKDPLKNIAWLKDEYSQMSGQPTINGIVLYRYNDSEVIEIQNAQFSSTNQHQYYCDGTKLNLGVPADFNKYRQDRKLIGILFGTNIWN
ncbi:hypothetical protein WAE58_07790 [Pedobacter panaciterrae]|jgi:hypothetical protein|uniref:Uncharacterized protein n=1 Tax=Pedobacter panaciterrae TaxID=363849 RepID=A0ABU8NJ94_9SPHI|nr:hypothetical protein [Pedobacter panaciterrae]NQX55952.1 hypothetical protein [Pedobacter panaciterrae]